MNLWTNEEITKILKQLDEMKLPFNKYSFVKEQSSFKLLGRGGFAEVYEAETRKRHKNKYAIKVIGFRNHATDSKIFNESVEVQKNIDEFYNNVVKIYDYVELWVSLDEHDNVVSAVKEKPSDLSGNVLHLQFIVMEKISSVIDRTRSGNIKMNPQELALGDETEVLKFAYDIGIALQNAHAQKVLHRDVKLENVFYSEKKKKYKLGDFGIAKKTEDGFAGTIAFTKGYAAPEVRMSDERYDNTADIYSFGMMLYVLMNNLKFPDSNTYNVNSGVQYSPGYIVPPPESDISEEFYNILVKACMYDADQRYQTMEEMILDIEKLMYGKQFGYKKEHKDISLVVGTILLTLGIVVWKLTLAQDISVMFSLWEYIFLVACIYRGILNLYKKESDNVAFIILAVGIYLLISTGFSWIKLLLVLWMACSMGVSVGYLSMEMLLVNFISLIQKMSGSNWSFNDEYSWVAITLISLGAVLLVQYALLVEKDREIVKMMYKRNAYWIWVCIAYFSIFLCGQTNSQLTKDLLKMWFGNTIENAMYSVNLKMIGISGLLFCIFWITRERILLVYQKRNEKRNN